MEFQSQGTMLRSFSEELHSVCHSVRVIGMAKPAEKYTNKQHAKAKQHQVDHMTEDYAGFLDQMDADHEENIKRMKDEHKAHKEKLIAQHEKQKADLMAEAEIEIMQNDTGEPLELTPDIIILPGDYYAVDPIGGPYGISAADLAANYEKV